MACQHTDIIAKPLGGRVPRFFVAARKLRTKGGNGTTRARIVAMVGREVLGDESLQAGPARPLRSDRLHGLGGGAVSRERGLRYQLVFGSEMFVKAAVG